LKQKQQNLGTGRALEGDTGSAYTKLLLGRKAGPAGASGLAWGLALGANPDSSLALRLVPHRTGF